MATTDLSIKFKRLRFPAAAGEAQAAGDTRKLISALGSDYDQYHAFLAKRMEGLGGEPDPADYRKDYEGYMNACDDVLETVMAERLLRQSATAVKSNRALTMDEDSALPLIDARQRLVSVTTGEADPTAKGISPRKPVPSPFAVGEAPGTP